MPEADLLRHLARIDELHEIGVLDDEAYAVQRARVAPLLATTSAPAPDLDGPTRARPRPARRSLW